MITRASIAGREWLKVISAPRLKVLRIHLFGLTLGLTALLTHLIFASATGLSLALTALAWFIIAYLFGFIFAQLYNYFVYLYLQILHPEFMKLWFYYDPNQEVNVIKTPIPERDWEAGTRRLYAHEPFNVFDHQPYPTMRHPYTIVFVANPLIRTDTGLQDDPIMDDHNLFLKAIERALFSFEFNHEVIGRPDIWSKIRIITVNPAWRFHRSDLFTRDATSALVKEFNGTFQQEGTTLTFSTFMLRPTAHVVSFVRNALEKYYNELQEVNNNTVPIEHIDVIFALSAHETHDRSTADPTVFADGRTNDNRHRQGKSFTISFDPYCQKQSLDAAGQMQDEILKSACEKSLCAGTPPPDSQNSDCQPSTLLPRVGGPDRVHTHEYFPPREGLGRVALSVLDVRDKLPVHEFAHAMSAVENGLLVDEYFDYALIREAGNPAYDPFDPEHFFVNRIFRNPDLLRDNHTVKVHNIFARYNGYLYESDRQHHSARQGWLSYFPERRQREVRCTMDAAQDVFEFDELIRDFMYDRLWAKVNRDFA